ncbi:hypothetical protein APICC_09065 [Apis cerana cerana]|uniref:Uncharacterized protein n=1 Tax=Apis cerana cerana TaxID=94128 RepID=A0A2A3EJY5_APICC|nr:hypothetical protein APICC_09065 [Apis cerana cerana]
MREKYWRGILEENILVFGKPYTVLWLEYLQLLYENKSHEFKGDFEYLLENSAYEKIGHFILRLFLKDGGMQLEDTINYWKEEYSKPHICSSTCSHK